MADNVRVLVVTKDEPNTDTARVGIWVKVGNVGDSSRVGESDPDWRGGVIEMGSSGELLGLLRRSERSSHSDSLGVCCCEIVSQDLPSSVSSTDLAGSPDAGQIWLAIGLPSPSPSASTLRHLGMA